MKSIDINNCLKKACTNFTGNPTQLFFLSTSYKLSPSQKNVYALKNLSHPLENHEIIFFDFESLVQPHNRTPLVFVSLHDVIKYLGLRLSAFDISVNWPNHLIFKFARIYFHRVELVVLAVLHLNDSAESAVPQKFCELVFPIEVLLSDPIMIMPGFRILG